MSIANCSNKTLVIVEEIAFLFKKWTYGVIQPKTACQFCLISLLLFSLLHCLMPDSEIVHLVRQAMDFTNLGSVTELLCVECVHSGLLLWNFIEHSTDTGG